jgi:hypothetical protein
MSGSLLIVDTNLLIVLVVAMCGPEYVGRAKRTERYTKEDAALLGSIVSRYDGVLVTPQILTEVSNLSGQITGKLFWQVRDALELLVPQWAEHAESSADLVGDSTFRKFGVTDAAIRRASGRASAVLSDDLPLCDALGRQGITVINFATERAQRL